MNNLDVKPLDTSHEFTNKINFVLSQKPEFL
jgi:hypothetical protein